MKYKIGQILTSTEDLEVKKALSDEKVIVPKGNQIIVGGDGFAHHIGTGMIQPFPEGTEFSGYDCSGLAKYLMICLKSRFPLGDMMDDHDIAEDEFRDEIEYFLNEIF